MNVTGISTERLANLQLDLHREDGQRVWVDQSGVAAIAASDQIIGRLKAARDRARADALKNLARYKFSNFGYHAARWVTLNALIGDRQPDPFGRLVDLAREMSR